MRGWLLLGVWLVCSAFQVNDEVAAERKAQAALPHSSDPTWGVLTKTKITLDEKNWLYSAVIAPEVKALEGKPMKITGFMMPLEQAQEQKHFLLSRLTPVCGFCPPGEPNEVIEVFTPKGIKFTYDPITIHGIFALTSNGEKGIFYQMKNAAMQ